MNAVATSIKYATVRSSTDKLPQPAETSDDDFISLFKHEIGTKDGTGFIPATFSAPGKHDRDVEHVTMLVQDVDDHVRDIDAYLAQFPWAGIAYTTFRHTSKKPKFRVILFLTRPVTPEEFADIWEWMLRRSGRVIDAKCKNPARLYFFPRVPDEIALQSAWVRVLTGPVLTPEECITLPEGTAIEVAIEEAVHQADREGSRNRAGYDLARKLYGLGQTREQIKEIGLRFIGLCKPGDHPYTLDEFLRSLEQVEAHPPVTAAAADFTEMALADRFLRKHGADVRYVKSLRSWFWWDGRIWCRDETGRVQWMISDLVRGLGVMKLESAAKLRGALEIAGSDVGISIRVGDLDADPWLLTCRTGTISLRDGTLRPFSKTDMITRLADLAFEPDATCPRFLKFLDEIMNGDQEMITLLRRWFGYSLTADVSEHRAMFFVGSGRNGKGVLIRAIKNVLGALAAAAPEGLLTVSRFEKHPAELETLRGRRLIIASELPKTCVFNEARLKTLTGGDEITAHGMRENYADLKPTAKILIQANHKPRVRDDSPAFWERMLIVEFPVSFAGREDRGLDDDLKAESPGIFAWLVRACIEWQRERLPRPRKVLDAVKSYRDHEDVVGVWLKDREERGEPDKLIPVKDLREDFDAWAKTDQREPRSWRSVANALRDAGWKDTRPTIDNKVVRCWSSTS